MKEIVSHCSDCDVCILELDHHCVFFDRCIGDSNMNLFVCTICWFFLILIFTVILAAMSDH